MASVAFAGAGVKPNRWVRPGRTARGTEDPVFPGGEFNVRHGKCLLVTLLGLAVWLTVCGMAQAQDTSTAPAGGPSQSVGNTDQNESSAPQEQPDTHPLAGAYLSTLGSAPELHSYLQPFFSIGELLETSPYNIPGTHGQLYPITVPMVGVELQVLHPSNDFSLGYQGGGFIYDNGAAPGASFHTASIMDSIQFRRGSLTLEDLFSYMPEAGFGLPGAGMFGGLGVGSFSGLGLGGGAAVNPAFVPNESILTGRYGAFNNTALIQGVYELTGRTSISAMGAYGLLQFNGSAQGFTNGNDYDGLLGLNHEISARDTIGVSYVYTSFHYDGSPISFTSQAADFTYGRKITGRLALQLYLGPELVTYKDPPVGTLQSVYASGMLSLTYALGRNGFSLYGGRFASGGGGVINGAETTMFSGGWHRELTRTWMSDATVGYSLNSTLKSALLSTGQHYDYWFGDLTLDHNIGRYVRFYVGYEYQRQAASGTCNGAVCGLGFNNQVFGVGLSFTPHPFAL